jgi:diguanylate cyclase (GGDEF)-like protein
VNPIRTPRPFDFALFLILYFLGAKLGIWLTVMPGGMAILWPPIGLLLAALIRFQGRGFAPFVLLAIAAEVAAFVPPFSLAEAVLFSLIHVLEAAIAFVLLDRWGFNPRFDAIEDVMKFVLAGPVIAAIASSFFGVLVYSRFRSGVTGYFEFLRIFWFGDGLGIMIFTPLLLNLWFHVGDEKPPTAVLRPYDYVVGLGTLAAVGLLSASRNGVLFGIDISPVILLPFVIFAAARFKLRWVSLTVVVTAFLVVGLMTGGRRPFGNLPPRDAVFQAQEFIFLTSLIALGLSALLSQLQDKQNELEITNQSLNDLNLTLEARVGQRTAELKTLNEQLAHLALTDALTALPNRRSFFELANREIDRCKRHGRQMALAMLDIDHFKRINDRYGHQAGDGVLQQVAVLVRGAIRASDTVARYGGEEFVLLMPETDLKGAAELVEQLRQVLRSGEIQTGREIVRITGSFGVTALSERDDDLDRLLRRADKALYAAKAGGRDRTVTVPV